jgi:hypothetical protein
MLKALKATARCATFSVIPFGVSSVERNDREVEKSCTWREYNLSESRMMRILGIRGKGPDFGSGIRIDMCYPTNRNCTENLI